MNRGVRNASNWILVIFGIYPALFSIASNQLGLCHGQGGGSLTLVCSPSFLSDLLAPAEMIWIFYLVGFIYVAVPVLLACLGISIVYEFQQIRLTGTFMRYGILIPIIAPVLLVFGFGDYLLKLTSMSLG